MGSTDSVCPICRDGRTEMRRRWQYVAYLVSAIYREGNNKMRQ